MMNLCFTLLTVCLSVIGIFALMYCLIGYFYSQKEDTLYFLIPVNENDSDLELRIKAAQFQIKRTGARGEKTIILLDNGMSEEMREIALVMMMENENIILVRANELKKLR